MKILLLLLSLSTFAQMTAKKGPMLIGSGQKKPDPSAVLEVFSNAKGFLPPRLTTIERDAIVSPASGLEIYNVDSDSPQFFNGVTWVSSGGTGTSFFFTSVAHGRPIGCPLSPVYYDGTTWVDSAANSQHTLATHVITKVIDANTIEISQSGRFSCNGHGLTVGNHYYTGVAGGLANVPAPAYDNPVVMVENANTVHVMPYRASTPAIRTVSQVDMVFGRIGDVLAQAGDYSANLITFSPTGTLVSTNVQDALAELDTNVNAIDISNLVPNNRNINTGIGLQGGGDLSADRTIGLDYTSLGLKIAAPLDELAVYDGAFYGKVTVNDIQSNTNIPLANITDVNTTALNGQVLTYDGVNFVFTDKTINTDNQTASEVPFSPFSFYTSTNVQSVLQEIETSIRADLANKAEDSINMIAGFGLTGGGDLTANRTFDVVPSSINISSLGGYNPNSFIDMSTINIDVSNVEDGLHITNTNSDGSLDEDVRLAVDIPSLPIENPARVSTQLMGFSTVINKLVRVSVQGVADTAAAAVVVPVDEVNGQTGIVALDADDIPETATRKYFTPAERAAIVQNRADIDSNDIDIASNASNISSNATAIGTNQLNITSNDSDISTLQTDLDAAEVTISSLGLVAFSDDYNDLINKPVLGTAAATSTSDYATAAQGALANTATQPGDNISSLVNDANYATAAQAPVQSVNAQTGSVVLDADDIADTVTTNKFATQAQLDQIATNQGNIATNASNIIINGGDITQNRTDIDSNDVDIAQNVTNIANHIADSTNPHNVTKAQLGLGNVDNTSDLSKPISTATQTALNLKANQSAISTVGFSNDYNDLTNLPTLGTAAATAITDYATAAQGALANTALQSGDNVSVLVNDAGYITSAGSPVQSVNSKTGVVTLNASEIPYTPAAGNFYSPAVAFVKAALDQLDVRNNTNATNITNNSNSITTNSNNTASNASAITTLSGRVNTAETNITNNTSNITANSNNIATNTTNISSNTTNISSNTTNIATNTTNISSNTTAINSKADKTITITGGGGLTGGGDLSVNRVISLPDVGTAGTYGSAVKIPVITTDSKGRVSSITLADTSPPVSYAASNATNSTASLTYVVIPSMSITPPAGTYRVMGGTSVTTDTTGSEINLAVFSGGAIATGSERTETPRAGGGSGYIVNINTLAEVTVNGSQAIELRWKTSMGLASSLPKNMAITRVK